MDERLIESLAAAVRAAPDDLPLRLHLAGLLVEADRGAEAVEHVATALAKDPTSAQARELMARAMGTAPAASDPAAAPAEPSESPDSSADAPPAKPSTFDWHAAESDLGETVGPMFVDGSTEDPGPSAYDVEAAGVRLADVGGLTEVKKRLEASFLAPLRNPELRALYGKSLRGGLLLYGPPGCGKTFLAKAVAGELGASFLHVSLADVLDMYIGQSERNVKELFEVARTSAPCVLFLDELDAIGGKRSLNRSSGARTTVNQLLTELDGVGSDNEGVFVLAATNHPWDVDPALRRPGSAGPHPARAAPGPRGARGDPAHPPARPARGAHRHPPPRQGDRGLQRRRPRPPVRVGLGERPDGVGRLRAGADDRDVRLRPGPVRDPPLDRPVGGDRAQRRALRQRVRGVRRARHVAAQATLSR